MSYHTHTYINFSSETRIMPLCVLSSRRRTHLVSNFVRMVFSAGRCLLCEKKVITLSKSRELTKLFDGALAVVILPTFIAPLGFEPDLISSKSRPRNRIKMYQKKQNQCPHTTTHIFQCHHLFVFIYTVPRRTLYQIFHAHTHNIHNIEKKKEGKKKKREQHTNEYYYYYYYHYCLLRSKRKNVMSKRCEFQEKM